MNAIAAHRLADIGFVEYSPADRDQIVNFFQECGYPHTTRFWEWINLESPDGPTIARYAQFEGKIIAAYAVLPRRLGLGRGEVLAGLGIHLAAHPDYRSTWGTINLVKRLFKDCEANNLAFIYGFPNDNSWLISQRLLGWQAIADLPALEVDRRQLISRLDPVSQTGLVLLQFTEAHASLLSRAQAAAVAPIKTAAYLNWRYANHPTHSYYLVEERQNGSVSGFLVLKLYQKDGVLYGHILEWGLPATATDLLATLLAKAANFFSTQNVDFVSGWLPAEHPFYPELTALGFCPGGFKTHFGYRPFGQTVALAQENWFMTMGDSDAF